MGRRSGVFRASAFFRFNTVPPVNREKTSPYDQITSRDEVTSPFYVVGIGASAGGLAAFEAFFSGMSKGTSPGMAFVLVQHLAPNHKSLLAEIVGRYANLPVFEATDGVVVKGALLSSRVRKQLISMVCRIASSFPETWITSYLPHIWWAN